MSVSLRSERWMLPDGIEEMLPEQAMRIQSLRRSILDLFRVWGYDYVIPPMVEFIDSLLTGTGDETDLRTCKLTDQLTGKTMGVRADITPQVARIDAHSMQRNGVNRLCYSGHVMHARPRGPLASRLPVQAGVEIFGDDSIDADIEVLSLLASSLIDSGVKDLHIDLAQVTVFRSLVKHASLSDQDEVLLRELVRNRRVAELQGWLDERDLNADIKAAFTALPTFIGGIETLSRARPILSKVIEFDPIEKDLTLCYHTLVSRFPELSLSIDLSELRGYSYHTGIVFGAYTGSVGHSLASGGRYDKVGECFGRARPATGFVINVSALAKSLASTDENQPSRSDAVFVPAAIAKSEGNYQLIKALRQAGRRVVVGLSEQEQPESYQNCTEVMEADGTIHKL